MRVRRLLSLAAVLDGMSREEAAEIGAMDRRTLRDWVHRFNANGAAGLINGKAPGPRPKLSPEQKQELKRIVETPPAPIKDGVVRCRCVDLRYIIKERFDVDLDEVSIGRVLINGLRVLFGVLRPGADVSKAELLRNHLQRGGPYVF
jgi:transposase